METTTSLFNWATFYAGVIFGVVMLLSIRYFVTPIIFRIINKLGILVLTFSVISCAQVYTEATSEAPMTDETDHIDIRTETTDYFNGVVIDEMDVADKELRRCCSVYDFDKDQLMRCWTANNRCDECYDLCERWTGNNLKPTTE
jgi:hypothetical protein